MADKIKKEADKAAPADAEMTAKAKAEVAKIVARGTVEVNFKVNSWKVVSGGEELELDLAWQKEEEAPLFQLPKEFTYRIPADSNIVKVLSSVKKKTDLKATGYMRYDPNTGTFVTQKVALGKTL